MAWDTTAVEPETWISLKDLLLQIREREIASHVSEEKTLIVKDLMRGIRECRKLEK